jgi:glycosyltransferase involved in cell wall biosynthesis
MCIEHVSVCIPTYKRPEYLERLLTILNEQKTNGYFSFSIVVIDNDVSRSAKDIIDIFKRTNSNIYYDCEPIQNISLTRNKAVKSSTGQYIAFIDDDEFPENSWLLNHFLFLKKENVDGVLGPVLPHFPYDTPVWLIKSSLCNRPTLVNGTVLKSHQTRTGNVFLKSSVFKRDSLLFDPSFGLSGGEDTDFFTRAIDSGYKFIWCADAPVYETVPPVRWKKSFYIKRAFLRGRNNFISSRNRPLKSKIATTVKSLIAFTVYTSLLPSLLFMPEHKKMNFYDSYFHHAGRLISTIGLDVIKQRKL